MAMNTAETDRGFDICEPPWWRGLGGPVARDGR